MKKVYKIMIAVFAVLLIGFVGFSCLKHYYRKIKIFDQGTINFLASEEAIQGTFGTPAEIVTEDDHTERKKLVYQNVLINGNVSDVTFTLDHDELKEFLAEYPIETEMLNMQAVDAYMGRLRDQFSGIRFLLDEHTCDPGTQALIVDQIVVYYISVCTRSGKGYFVVKGEVWQ